MWVLVELLVHRRSQRREVAATLGNPPRPSHIPRVCGGTMWLPDPHHPSAGSQMPLLAREPGGAHRSCCFQLRWGHLSYLLNICCASRVMMVKSQGLLLSDCILTRVLKVSSKIKQLQMGFGTKRNSWTHWHRGSQDSDSWGPFLDSTSPGLDLFFS